LKKLAKYSKIYLSLKVLQFKVLRNTTMGRKVDYAEKPKKGPGRKSKKQSDPALGILSGSIKNKEVQALKKQITPIKAKEDAVEKKMSSHQKKRAKKREEKKIAKKAGIKRPKPKAKVVPKESSDGESEEDIYNSDSSVEEEEVVESEEEEEQPAFLKGTKAFTDDNKEWLTPKKLEGMNSNDESSEDDDVQGEEEEEDSDDNLPADDFEAGSDASDDSDSDDSSDSDDNAGEDDDGLLPIERKSKKLAKKMKVEAEESQKEMQLNMTNREIFTLPSGQDIEKESAQAPDLQILQERIREVIK
jgi:ribosomal RNA methyltransferase Nop2